MRILVIEDDQTVAGELSAAFNAEGWSVDVAGDGAAGLAAAAASPYSVIVLDRMLPKMDGIEVLERLRGYGVRTPVLILSAMDEIDARVDGIERGADDYLTKPFTMIEVLARLRALNRRSSADPHPEVLVRGPMELWLKAGRLFVNGAHVEISPKEFDLLSLLMRNAGDPVTRRMILENVFNWRAADDPGTNIVDVHIHRLRQKLEAGTGFNCIRTVRHKGYSFVFENVDP